jgi:DNA-binding MarR family transcriptional regulator
MPPPTLFALKRAYQAVRNALDAELQGKGLTAAQFDVLKLLLRPEPDAPRPAGHLDQRAMQKALRITSATLTRLLAGMERRGLINRSANPQDSRSKRVKATAKARKLFTKLMAGGEATFHARVLQGFSDAETLILTRLLERVAENLRE